MNSYTLSFCRLLPIAGLCMTVLLLSACGANTPRQIRGELPLIELDSLTREDNAIHLDLGIRNINDSSLDIPSIRILLEVDGKEVAELADARADLSVSARGREVIRLSGQGTSNLHAGLDALASGERRNLPWIMTVELGRSGRRDQETEASGFLHSVPGQPDRFR